jgi:hypothetical protein
MQQPMQQAQLKRIVRGKAATRWSASLFLRVPGENEKGYIAATS